MLDLCDNSFGPKVRPTLKEDNIALLMDLKMVHVCFATHFVPSKLLSKVMWLMELELIVAVLLPKRYLLLVVVYVSFRMETTLNSWMMIMLEDIDLLQGMWWQQASSKPVAIMSYLDAVSTMISAGAGINGRPSAPTIDSRGNNIDKHHNCQSGLPFHVPDLRKWKFREESVKQHPDKS
ncbi:hypothetical protein Tco_0128349 [Tanacetum coccineum]